MILPDNCLPEEDEAKSLSGKITIVVVGSNA